MNLVKRITTWLRRNLLKYNVYKVPDSGVENETPQEQNIDEILVILIPPPEQLPTYEQAMQAKTERKRREFVRKMKRGIRVNRGVRRRERARFENKNLRWLGDIEE